MSDLTIRTMDDQQATVADASLDELARGLRGEVITPMSKGYDEARKIWNAMVDRRPALIVRCNDVGDVQKAIGFATERDLLISIRGGGHNIAGSALADRGLMIDLSAMRSVTVDAARKTARVAGGALLADFDREAQKHGLAVPLGINSTTGVGGLTLGGGFGWLTRKFGMTVDSLISAQVVTVDGKIRTASPTENADLFWAIRGGGGNFGVVTEFEFRLHPVGPQVLAGMVVHPMKEARAALDAFRSWAATAPDEATGFVVLRKAPPLPFLKPEVHGTPILVLAMCYAGDPAQGEKALKPLRTHGKPLADVVGPMPYVAFQQTFDPLLTPGARNYWKSHNMTELKDGALDKLIEAASKVPDPACEIFVGQLGGAAERVAPDATAWAHRNTRFVANVHGRWPDAAGDRAGVAWARDTFRALEPFSSGSVYVNFMTEEETSRVPSAFGSNHARLLEIKRKYDPQNRLRMNQNLRPLPQA